MIPLLLLTGEAHIHDPANLARIPDAYDVRDGSGWPEWSPEQLLKACRDAEVIVTGRRSPRLPEGLIERPGRVKWVCHLYGTIRHLLRREHLEAGITVTNWGDTIRPVSEGTLALLMCQLRQIPLLDRYSETGERSVCVKQDYAVQLRGMRVGLYGCGPIGGQLAASLVALGAGLAIYDPYMDEPPPGDVKVCETLEELFESVPAVCVMCGLNDQTRNTVTRDLLERLPQGGVLINTARGEIVDEDALAELVSAGRLLAGCDVIRNEGDWPGSPLAGLNGATLTRHAVGQGINHPVGGEASRPLPQHYLDNLAAYAAGRPLEHTIPPKMYDLKT
jgi:phosphoglycerate dehydrogenase-like enzyme